MYNNNGHDYDDYSKGSASSIKNLGFQRTSLEKSQNIIITTSHRYFKKRLEVLMRPFVSKVTTVDLLIADVYQSQNCRGDSNHQS